MAGAGACATADPDLFFPGRARDHDRQADAHCDPDLRRLPVRRQCLEFAVNTGELYGIWGGTTPEERMREHRAELARRRAARRRAEPEQPAA